MGGKARGPHAGARAKAQRVCQGKQARGHGRTPLLLLFHAQSKPPDTTWRQEHQSARLSTRTAQASQATRPGHACTPQCTLRLRLQGRRPYWAVADKLLPWLEARTRSPTRAPVMTNATFVTLLCAGRGEAVGEHNRGRRRCRPRRFPACALRGGRTRVSARYAASSALMVAPPTRARALRTAPALLTWPLRSPAAPSVNGVTFGRHVSARLGGCGGRCAAAEAPDAGRVPRPGGRQAQAQGGGGAHRGGRRRWVACPAVGPPRPGALDHGAGERHAASGAFVVCEASLSACT